MVKINCDMCGRESSLFKTDVEGSMISLCGECSKFGKVIAPVKEVKTIRPVKIQSTIKEEEYILTIVSNYGDIIKKKREELMINQEDFAKRINEKKALIHKIETGQLEPPINLARKIEKFLHISLIEQQDLKVGKLDKSRSESFTIGDFIKVKK